MNDKTKNEKIVHVAVDDGFRQIKIVTSEGFQISIPSTVRAGFSVTRIDDGKDLGAGAYNTEAQDYTVDGDIEGEDTRFNDYAYSSINRVLIHHALHLGGVSGRKIALCTGVPFESYFRSGTNDVDAAMVERKTASLNIDVKALNGAAAPIIVRQQVAAQGVAAYIEYLTDARGNPREHVSADAPVAVVDIGGRTTDTVTLLGGGRVDHAMSGTAAVGISNVFDLIGQQLSREFGTPSIKLSVLDKIARQGVVRWQGQDRDVSGVVQAASNEVAQQIIRELKRRIGKAGDLDAVLLTGGGAGLMHAAILQEYPHAIIMDDPSFANARGMLKVLKYGEGHAEG